MCVCEASKHQDVNASVKLQKPIFSQAGHLAKIKGFVNLPTDAFSFYVSHSHSIYADVHRYSLRNHWFVSLGSVFVLKQRFCVTKLYKKEQN